MKTITCTIAALLFSAFVMNAQENVDVKKETTTKKVVVKGTTVETKVVNEVKQEKKIIQVQDSDAVNSKPSVITRESNKTEVVQDEVKENAENKAEVQNYQNKEKADVDAVISEQRKAKQAADSDVDAIKKANMTDEKNKKSNKVKNRINN